MPISKNALYRHDMTIALPFLKSHDGQLAGLIEISLKDNLHLMCKDFTFQLERGKKGSYHFQCRISLKKKAKTMVVLDDLYQLLSEETRPQESDTDNEIKLWDLNKGHIHISPTQSKTKGFDYVMKSETRVRDTITSKPVDLLIPQDIIEEEKFNSLQSFISEEWIRNANKWDPLGRRILSVVDGAGGTGKSQVPRTLCYKYPDLYAEFDGDTNMERLVASVINAGPRKAYFIDLPRASENVLQEPWQQAKHTERINNVLRFCEKLKNGNVSSSFYGKYSQLIMTRPAVIIFSNWPLGQTGLSSDRLVELDPSSFTKAKFWEKYDPYKTDSSYSTLLNKVNNYS